jgi:putative oxidoreductase
MKHLVLIGRLVFGLWMLANGANHFFFSLWPEPTGHEPLAVQLMDALVHSRLIDVVMTIELVTGALILAGFFVPLALCLVMPISTCALFWSAVLDHQPLGAVLALTAFALNGLLMLAYIDYYKGVLQRHALMLGEA